LAVGAKLRPKPKVMVRDKLRMRPLWGEESQEIILNHTKSY
jgi:hypothetical protein